MSLALGGPGLVSDSNPALIALYQAVQNGWDPPSTLSSADYAHAKTLPDSDPLKAFAGFGCSFGGKWFGGYARSGSRNFAEATKRIVKRDVLLLVERGCAFACIDFLSVEPFDCGCVLYLDPPYRGSTGYRFAFDSAAFDRRVTAWSQFTHVFVSEYELPDGIELLRFNKKLSVCQGQKANPRDERLFYLGPLA